MAVSDKVSLKKSIVEDAVLEWFGELGCALGHGARLASGEPAEERDSFGEVVLEGRLREAVRRLNPVIPDDARAVVANSATVQTEGR